MPRGNNNNNRGRGGGHGNGRGRGRGRGQGTPVRGGAPAHGPRQQYAHTNAEFDFVIQEWEEGPSAADAGRNPSRGRGFRGGGTPKSGAGTPSRGMDSPRRGDSTPGRGRGRGAWRGRGGDPFYGPRRPSVGFGAKGAGRGNVLSKDAPLSALLSAERPLLRPVKFVRATLTPFLFQHSEDLLEATPESADTTEASRVPTADRAARLFRRTTSDSDSDGNASDALEEIDFADLAKVREEVDAIAEASKRQDARPEEAIEEVDFADLAKIRAEVDAAHARASSQDTVIEETFTGVYNLPKDANQASSAMDVVDVDRQDRVQLSTVPSMPVISNDESLESIDASKESTNESLAEAQDMIFVEEETNGTPNGPSEMLTDEIPSLPETQAIAHPDVAMTTQEVSLPASNPPPTTSPQVDDSPPLFVIDTAPSLPFAKRSTSDVILVDRTGRGETLGEEDELIVYVAPHPRSGRASPIPNLPRVNLPNTSILSGKSSVQAAPADVSGLRSPIREDELGEDAGSTVVHARERDRTTQSEEVSLSLPLPDLEISPANGRQRQSKAALKAQKKKARLHRARERNTKRRGSGFGSFGAMMSEAVLRDEDERERRLPKWETRRRGDSDIDWGTDDEGEGEDGDGDDRVTGMGVGDDGVDGISNGLGGMDLDPELELDVGAMKGFLKSMSAEGSRFVTTDDIADEARMRREDEEGLGGPMGSSDSGSSDEEDEEEAVFNAEEKIMIAESGGEEDDDDDKELSEDSDDDERLSPNSGFKARLRRVRERSRGQRPTRMQDISDEDEDEEDLPEPHPFTRGADDEAFLAQIDDLLEENSAILSGRDRKKRNALFRNLHQGYVDEYDIEDYLDEFTTPVKSKKGKKGKPKKNSATGIFEAELTAQWEKDRAKKADYKRERAAARLAVVLDPLSASSPSSHSRTSRKAMRSAARLDPTLALSYAPLAPVDLASLESQLRRFVADIGGRSSLALPPMDKSSRMVVHDLATAFGLASKSKGEEGKGRYTVVMKTTRTGVGMINEGMVRAVRNGGGGWGGWGGGGKGRGRGDGREKGGKVMMPRHKEGDEVGKEAPKIGQSNIGFKMLASMGWSEGDRIGGTASVGIEAPLTAIIKNSKLGLGATR